MHKNQDAMFCKIGVAILGESVADASDQSRVKEAFTVQTFIPQYRTIVIPSSNRTGLIAQSIAVLL